LENSALCRTRKQIAYIPTWRDWIKKGSFLDSKFFKYVSSFLVDRMLAELLEKRNVILKFYLHKNMKGYLSFFKSKNSKIQLIEFGQESVQEMVKESNLLITDYSSVSWDFFYLDKPVIFFQFDCEDYLNYRGSYLDFKKDVFGDHADSKYNLIDLIKHHIDNNFQANEKYKIAKPKFFKYSDRFNCKRIYQEIMKT
jgi:CDP-glycerol glycerophosphotransferase (TagB/SpsB family)